MQPRMIPELPTLKIVATVLRMFLNSVSSQRGHAWEWMPMPHHDYSPVYTYQITGPPSQCKGSLTAPRVSTATPFTCISLMYPSNFSKRQYNTLRLNNAVQRLCRHCSGYYHREQGGIAQLPAHSLFRWNAFSLITYFLDFDSSFTEPCSYWQ